jgi:serine/threonine-protein kinase
MAPGDLVAGRYRFRRVIGEGAMGTVIAAHHELLDVPVAVKFLSLDLTRKQTAVERFLREARAVARLKSEHVARVMDVGTLPTGQPFIVMELLEGADLERRIVRERRLPVADSVDFVLQALEAIAHAHGAGIVHRDLKPANLFITIAPDGREMVKVLDFGIAKLVDSPNVDREGRRTGALTGEHAALGSPSYMSPEQVRDSGSIDQRADLWAMGAILYELLSGVPAFDGHSVAEIFGAILHSRPAPLSQHMEAPPPRALEDVIVRCMEPDRDKRWADAAQLAKAIAPFGSGAWNDLVNRIEQTLARAAKTSGAELPHPAPARPGSESSGRSTSPDAPSSRNALAKRLLGSRASSGSRTSPVRPQASPATPPASGAEPAPSSPAASLDLTLDEAPTSNGRTSDEAPTSHTVEEAPTPAEHTSSDPAGAPTLASDGSVPSRLRSEIAPDPPRSPRGSRKVLYGVAALVLAAGVALTYASLREAPAAGNAIASASLPMPPPPPVESLAPAPLPTESPSAVASATPPSAPTSSASPGAVSAPVRPLPARPSSPPARKAVLPDILTNPK